MGLLCVFFKNKKLFLLKKTKKFGLKKHVFLKKRVFLNPDCLSILFVIFP